MIDSLLKDVFQLKVKLLNGRCCVMSTIFDICCIASAIYDYINFHKGSIDQLGKSQFHRTMRISY